MAVLEILENLDNVAEADKAKFKEVDGKFQREVEIPDVSTLESTLKKERDARKEMEKKVDALSGVDLDKYKDFIKKEEDGLSDKQKSDNALKKLNERIEKMETDHKSDLAGRDAKLQKFHLDEKSRKAAIAGGVLADDLDDVMIITAGQRKLDDDGNIIMVDADGDPTARSLEDFFAKDFKESKPKYYEGIPGGGGAPPGGKITNNKALLDLPPEERINVARGQKVG